MRKLDDGGVLCVLIYINVKRPLERSRRQNKEVDFVLYLRMATVMASGEVAHGQMTSGFSPWDWKTFRKASQDDTDPGQKWREKERVDGMY